MKTQFFKEKDKQQSQKNVFDGLGEFKKSEELLGQKKSNQNVEGSP